ncbi:MAG: ATP synthase F1 subunit gamma [Bacilli bacterium]|nr:ATP synthase F1 subunit gamma [Bacilli bacterium]
MAQSIRSIKSRISATKKTSQITKAMNMVSASKLKGAEKSIKEYLPFTDKVKSIVGNLVKASETLEHPILKKREIKTILYVVVTSDRGLAGAFNSSILKTLDQEILNNKHKNYMVMPLGLKAYTYVKKRKYPTNISLPVSLKDNVEFSEISEVVHKIVLDYLSYKIDCVKIIYNHHINTLIQEVMIENLLPIQVNEEYSGNISYEFDGGRKEILDTIFPIYIENSIYGMILDSKASEHAARMNAMQSATDNASEVIETLELLYNRARQESITNELTDIVGGASVINES